MKTNKSNSALSSLSIISALLLFMFISPGNSFAQTKEERHVSGFEGVSVATGIDLYLTQSNSESVVTEAKENVHKYIVTEVKGDILKIYFKQKHPFIKKPVKVHVSIKTLKKLKGSSGSDIYGQNQFNVDKLEIDLSSGSDLKFDLTANEIDCDISSGSDIKMSGKTNLLRVNASSGSDFKAFDLIAKKCNINASSASDISIHVTEELDADASSSSDVYYKGNPEKVYVNASSGADIHRR